jgi:hypothetical protein
MQVIYSQQSGTYSPYHTNTQKKSEDEKQEIKDFSQLSVDEQALVQKLQSRDTEVKAHEAAHQAAGGGMTGGASYSYEKGPDGRMYAIGGEVSISTKSGSTPQEEIANARQVQAAAMAPANPSSQDFSVASSAKIMEMKAQQKLMKQQQEELYGLKTYQNNSLTLNPEQNKIAS